MFKKNSMSKTKLKSILAFNRVTRCKIEWNKWNKDSNDAKTWMFIGEHLVCKGQMENTYRTWKKSYTNAWLFGGEEPFWKVHLT
jgi:hypothetical protein